MTAKDIELVERDLKQLLNRRAGEGGWPKAAVELLESLTMSVERIKLSTERQEVIKTPPAPFKTPPLIDSLVPAASYVVGRLAAG